VDTPRPTTDPSAQERAAVPVRWLVPGDTIGRYRIGQLIGQGGMGVVFSARDPRLSREVALKIIRAELGDGSYRARVLREAQSLARLSHPNVVPVFDVGIDLGVVWVAMQRVCGPSLAQWLAEGPAWPAVIDAFTQAGRGLAAAHAAGLVHRDFKPANAMFDGDPGDARVLVLDFGLAWAPQSSNTAAAPGEDLRRGASREPLGLVGQSLTATGSVVGTPPYMAPEQHANAGVDARSDQYALCVSIFEGVFGRRPFAGDLEALVAAKRSGPPARPIDPEGLPDRVWRVIERGLEPDPAKRWRDVDALLDALADGRRAPRRWPLVFGAAAIASAGMLAARGANEAPEPCAGLEALDRAWNDTRRDALAEAFVVLGAAKDASWPRIVARVDDTVAGWRAQAERSCAPPFDAATVACLEGAAFALDEALDVLAAAEPTRAARGVRMIESIAVTHRCDGADAPGPRLDAAMRRRYERVRALVAAGELDESAAIAREMLDEAHGSGDPIAVAWSLLQLGGSEMDRGERESAELHLRDALWTATAARDDLAVTTAAIKLVHLCAYAFDTACAEPWLRTAEAGLARLGPRGAAVERELDLARGDVALRDAAFDEALGHYHRALASARAAPGDVGMFESVVLHAIGAAQAAAGRHEEALATFSEADAVEARELGRGDTARSITAELRAGSLYALGRIPEARAVLEQGLVLLDAAYGEGHPHSIRARGNLVLLLLDGGELDGALALAKRVVELKREAFGPDDIQVAIGLYNEGTVHTKLGAHEVALARYDDALALWERARGPEHLDLAHPLSGQANALVELGDATRARAAGERALALHERHGVPVPGELLFDLGRAAWLQGDRAGAEALGRRAAAAMPAFDRPGHLGRADVEAWLAAHAT
jgi:tetratricopeptide (TPR) repeat protein